MPGFRENNIKAKDMIIINSRFSTSSAVTKGSSILLLWRVKAYRSSLQTLSPDPRLPVVTSVRDRSCVGLRQSADDLWLPIFLIFIGRRRSGVLTLFHLRSDELSLPPYPKVWNLYQLHHAPASLGTQITARQHYNGTTFAKNFI